MPGVVLYGKSWRWASDDLPLLAMISCVLYFTGVLVLMAYVPDIVDTPGCPAFEEYKLFYILSTSMGLKFVLSLCEVFVSLRGSIWETKKRWAVAVLVPIDSLLWLGTLCTTIFGTVMVQTGTHECPQTDVGKNISPIVDAVLIFCWVALASQMLSWLVAYRAFPKLDDSKSLETSKRYLDAMCCMGGLLNEFEDDDPAINPATGEVENTLSEVLTIFFGESNMTLSDLVASMQLAGYMQDKRRSRQMQELQAVLCVQPPPPLDQGTGIHEPQTSMRAWRSRRASEHFVTPPGAVYKMEANQGPDRNHEAAGLSDLIEAQHYLQFAVAAYGAKLYVYASKATCFGGALHLGGRAALRELRRMNRNVDRVVKEKGEHSIDVNALEKEAILEFSGLAEEDLVYVSQQNQKTGLLPYFIALDHSSRSVVLCIRGTMSVADCLTDVQFDPAPLGSFLQAESLRSLKRTKPFACKSSGVSKEREEDPGPHAHRGILKSAIAVLEDMEGHQLIESLLQTGRHEGNIEQPLPPVSSRAFMTGVLNSTANSISKRILLRPLQALGVESRDEKYCPDHVGSQDLLPRSPCFKGVIYRKPGGISLEPENHTEDATASGPHAPPDAKDVPSNVSCGASSQRWRRGGSQQHELWRSRMAKGEWRLVVTGHSLGAGVAALVALKLRPRHPTLKCWSFAPPGALVSREIAESMTDYCTSVAIGKDWVPRLNYASANALWDTLMMASTHCKLPKFAVLYGGMCGCFSTNFRDENMFYETHELPEEPGKVWREYCDSKQGRYAASMLPGLKFISPGKMLFLRPKKENPRSNKRTGYEPVWLEPGELQAEGLLISKRCMADHFPDFQLHTMTKLVKSLVADAPDEELRRTVYGETADVSNTEEKWSFPSRVSSGQHTTCVNLSTMAVPTPYLRRWMMSFSGRPHDRSAPTSSGIIEVEPRAGNGLTHITPESVVRDVPPQDHAAPAEAIDEA